MQNFTCENLSFYYGKKMILDKINFNLNRGDIVGLIGENGVGKTTLLKILAKIYKNKQLNNYTVSYLIEKPTFYPYLSGKQNLIYCSKIGIKSLYNITASTNLIGLKLDPKLKVQNYSLGMIQKLGIAKCLLFDTDIYLFDEPLNGLDARSIYNFRKIVEILRNLGKIVIISSHILSELEKYCNKLLIIKKDHQIKLYDLTIETRSIEMIFFNEVFND